MTTVLTKKVRHIYRYILVTSHFKVKKKIGKKVNSGNREKRSIPGLTPVSLKVNVLSILPLRVWLRSFRWGWARFPPIRNQPSRPSEECDDPWRARRLRAETSFPSPSHWRVIQNYWDLDVPASSRQQSPGVPDWGSSEDAPPSVLDDRASTAREAWNLSENSKQRTS